MKSYVITKVEITEVYPAFGDAVEMVRVNDTPVECGHPNSDRYRSMPVERYTIPLFQVAVPIRPATGSQEMLSFERFRLGLDHHGMPDTFVAAFREAVQSLGKNYSLRAENANLTNKVDSLSNDLEAAKILVRGQRQQINESHEDCAAAKRVAEFWRVGAIMTGCALIGLLAGYVFL